MDWEEFFEKVYNELANGQEISNFLKSFPTEKDLTHEIGIGIRKLFSKNFSVPINSATISEHVTFREGSTVADKRAWTYAKKDKWIYFHKLFFVPDILVRKVTGRPDNIFSIEVKLLRENMNPQKTIAEALGQTLMYSCLHNPVIAFIGVTDSVKWGKARVPQLTLNPADRE